WLHLRHQGWSLEGSERHRQRHAAVAGAIQVASGGGVIAALSPVARAWIGLVLAAVFWAGNALVARAVRDDIPPLSLSFWRWSLALAILLPFVAPTLWRERERIRRGGWRL